MGDYDDRGPARLEFVERLHQLGFAGRIQMGIGFVEQDDRRVAIKGAGNADALRLARGKALAAPAEERLIAARQLEDHVMGLGRLRGGDHVGIDAGPALEASDIFLDRAGQQRRVLGQEADEAAQPLGVPVGHLRSVDPHHAPIGARRAGQDAKQGRLASPARPDDRHHFARIDPKADVGQDRPLAVGIGHPDILGLDPALGIRKLGQRNLGAASPQHLVELDVGRPRASHDWPRRKQLVYRLQGAAG